MSAQPAFGALLEACGLRSVAAPRMLPDVQLDFWGDVYLANPHLSACGISFELFLAAPAQILFSFARPLGVQYGRGDRLLPAQRSAREEIEFHDAIRRAAHRAMKAADAEASFVSDGHLVERLKHRTWPRHRARRVFEEV